MTLACLWLAAPAAHAQGRVRPPVVAKVERLQLPAWVERAGVKAGIKPGWAIYAGDRLTTGADGRISLTVVGDAKLQVGGDTEILFTDATAAAEEATSLIKVSRGVFQFTAPAIGRAEGTLLIVGPETSATVFAGQVWGRADFQQELIVLMSGSVEVRGPQTPAVQMTQPETVMVMQAGQAGLPVIPVAKEKLARWLGQVEAVAGNPTLTAAGVWDVGLLSGYGLKQMEDIACALQSRGVPSEISEVRETGKKTWYRLVVRRFATRRDAADFARNGKVYGVKDPWILLPQS